VYRPGLFAECKAIGWYVDEYKRAQVSINLTNWKVTPPHLVLEEVRKLAAERGLVVTGSEVVGLIPWQALFEAGKYYLKKQGGTVGVPRVDVLRAAAFSMGLHDVAVFDIEKKALGLPRTPEKALVQMKVVDFADEVSRYTPAPGGGSIAALAGSLGASLASMVANLTYGKEGTEERDPELARIAEQAQVVKDRLMAAVDDDTNAFNVFMQALRLPQNTPEEKAIRTQKMQEGIKIAIEVPWGTATQSLEAMKLCRDVARIGNPNSLTDGAVGSQMAMAGVRGGLWNVVINLKDLKDTAYVREMQKKCDALLAEATALAAQVAAEVDRRLAEMIAKKHPGL
jgi:glutamate formiminotransferase/formiminotetrahydrofolate cyclodeaminase